MHRRQKNIIIMLAVLFVLLVKRATIPLFFNPTLVTALSFLLTYSTFAFAKKSIITPTCSAGRCEEVQQQTFEACNFVNKSFTLSHPSCHMLACNFSGKVAHFTKRRRLIESFAYTMAILPFIADRKSHVHSICLLKHVCLPGRLRTTKPLRRKLQSSAD